jgi:lipoprotein
MLQRIVQLILLLAFSIGCGLLYTPLLRLEFTLSAVGTFRLLPLWVLVVLLVLALAHWLPLRVLPWKKLESTAAFHRGRSVSFFIISIAISFLVTMLISFQFAPEALMRALY